MHGHAILIVEPEIGRFVLDLQTALEKAGAEPLVARDLNSALMRIEQFDYAAAVIRYDPTVQPLIARLCEELRVPVLVYGAAPSPFEAGLPFVRTPTHVPAILDVLRRMLA